MRIIPVVLLLVTAASASFTGSIDVYFSPNGGCRDAILTRFRAADSTIDAAIYTFTSPDIAACLDSAVMRGVRVRAVLDPNQALSQYCVTQSDSHRFAVRYGGGSGIMHDKFAVIDRGTTITGSYNWTAAAEERNDENLLVIRSRQVADTFAERFSFLWTYGSSKLNRPVSTPPSGAPAVTAPPPASAVAPAPAPVEGGETVYITKSGKKYHRYGCSSLSRSCIPISRREAEARGYTPCARCTP